MEFDINNPPEEITIDVFLSLSEYGHLAVSHLSIESQGYTNLAEPIKATFKLKKRNEITDGMVDNLKAEKQKLIADTEVKCNRIDDKINQLLALPAPDKET